MAPKSYPIYLDPEAYRALLDLRLKEETPGDSVKRILQVFDHIQTEDPPRWESLSRWLELGAQ